MRTAQPAVPAPAPRPPADVRNIDLVGPSSRAMARSGLWIAGGFALVALASGQPTWLVMPGGSWITPTSYSGSLYRTLSPATGTPLNQGAVSSIAVGSATLLFSDADNAELRYVVDGVTASKFISRLHF